MGNKRRAKNKLRKNRGGDRLAEWRVLKHYSLVPCSKSKYSTSCDVPSVENTSTPTAPESVERALPPNTPEPEEELPPLVVASGSDVVEDSCVVSGRRIVDIAYFINELKKLSNHAPQFGCSFVNMLLKCEITRGLRSGFLFQCSMCGLRRTVWSEEESSMDINSGAVAGTTSTGGGFMALETIMGAMNIRCMSYTTFDKHQTLVSKGWEEAALQEMKEAAEEEISLARGRGDVDRHGVPLLTVVADGSWAKRSYKTNYNSLSGVASILGYHTKKVIYFGVKNKYCVTCARYENKNVSSRDHVCFKNWTGSSSSMEAATIVEGFLASEEMYGVKYAKLIADGDSNVYHDILAARPYENLTVVKVECRNHLLRNFCNKLKEIATTSVRATNANPNVDQKLHLTLRRVLGANILRCRTGIKKAILKRKTQNEDRSKNATDLRKDIINAPSHVFGEHLKCAEIQYFCKGSKGDKNVVPEMKAVGIYQQIMKTFNDLADYSDHLIQDVDSNIVELYNASVAKFTGGKRVNYTQKGSYQVRCAAAVVKHNSGRSFYKLHKTLTKSSPANYNQLYEIRLKRKASLAAARNRKTPKAKRKLSLPKQKESSGRDDKHYGPSAQKPDLEEDLFNAKLREFLEDLKKTAKEIEEIECHTRNQFENQLWFEERRSRLTASNFGAVCNRKPYTKCSALVNKMLYSPEIDTTATRYGKMHEKTALEDLRKNYNINVVNSGLFIDEDLPFLAASPDGLIDDGEGLVEVKCPSTGVHKAPNEIMENKVGIVGNMWNKNSDGSLSVKKMHNYHLQVQGQLHIAKRSYCLFCVWTPLGLRVERISRDDDLWDTLMKPKLTQFYMTCLLPELIDPRRRRNMPIREPDHILQAIKRRAEKGGEKEDLRSAM